MPNRQKNPPIDTLIFDAEGVVVDTESLWDRCQEVFLGRRGVAYDRRRTKHLLTGRSLAEGVRIMQRQYGFGGDLEILARERSAIAADLFARGVHFVEGFREFFEAVRRNHKTCIATAMATDLFGVVDRRLGVRKLFGDRVYTLADVRNRSKPNPDLFLHAARELGSAPGTCLVLEDAPHGIEAARRAGMRCLALTTTYDAPLLSGADWVVGSYGEIGDVNSEQWTVNSEQ